MQIMPITMPLGVDLQFNFDSALHEGKFFYLKLPKKKNSKSPYLYGKRPQN